MAKNKNQISNLKHTFNIRKVKTKVIIRVETSREHTAKRRSNRTMTRKKRCYRRSF
jgi:hypothetical protein